LDLLALEDVHRNVGKELPLYAT